MTTKQQVRRFHVTVDEALVVRVLEGISHLLHVRDNRWEREPLPSCNPLAQRSAWCVIHHQVRRLLLYPVVQQANDMRMHEADQRLRFAQKAIGRFRGQGRGKDLDGRLTLQVHLLAQVDVSKPARSQQTREAIIPELLTDMTYHSGESSGCFLLWQRTQEMSLRATDHTSFTRACLFPAACGAYPMSFP